MNSYFHRVTNEDVKALLREPVPVKRPERTREKPGSFCHTITQHAVDALLDDLDPKDWRGNRLGTVSKRQSWVSLYWLFHHGRDANEYELEILHKDFEADAIYRLCDCCWGTFCMVIRRGTMVTCYELKYWNKELAA